MAESNVDARILAWYFGLDPKFHSYICNHFGDCRLEKIPFDLEFLMSENNTTIPSVVFCGMPPEGVSLAETAQTLRNVFPETPLFLILDSATAAADRAKMQKNGFNDIFFLPLDSHVLKSTIIQILPNLAAEKKRYRSVKLVDVQVDQKLEFDTFIYLPVNNRHVRLSTAQSSLRQNQIQKLKDNNMNSISISEDDLGKFYDYTAQALKHLQSDQRVSETERQERLQASVRDLFSGFFSDESSSLDEGKKVAEDCRKIVQQYMAGKINDIYQKLVNISTSEGDSYSHAMNVSAYAALFGMALGLNNIEDLSMAGLLHDIGMARVPMEIQQKDPSKWSAEEKKIYENHPEYSIEMIKEKKIMVKEIVFKAISQHHERANGSGYPKGPQSGKICIEAQILAFADEFDELMTERPGKPRLSPLEVAKKFHIMASGDPTMAIIDPELLRKILTIFPQNNSEKKTA